MECAMAGDNASRRTAVPSITLSITKADAQRFLGASQALNKSFAGKDPPDSAELYKAASESSNDFCRAFIDRMNASGISEAEIKTAVFLFYDLDKTAKLRHFFEALVKEPTRVHLSSLFRSILTALSCCVQAPDQANVVVEGKPGSPERKRAKRDEEPSDPMNDFRSACQSPSFDSSLATLRDEEEAMSGSSLRRDIEEVSGYAADALLQYADKKGDKSAVSFATFGDWYNEEGSTVVPWIELLQLSKWKRTSTKPTPAAKKEQDNTSPASLEAEESSSQTMISFDFTGSGSPNDLCINISEDNLHALRQLVHRTGLMVHPAADVCRVFLQLSCRKLVGGQHFMILTRDAFEHQGIPRIISKHAMAQLSPSEQTSFVHALLDFFSLYQTGPGNLKPNETDLKEVAIGICFFCAGNKSAKLATAFELLDDMRRGYLTEEQLFCFLRSYLMALVGISLLKPVSKYKQRRPISSQHRQSIRAAVESGAEWTLKHFCSYMAGPEPSSSPDRYSFECFANWYSTGGYNVAPWLELLDLNKVLSLINTEHTSPLPLPPLPQPVYHTTARRPPAPKDRMSSLRRHHSSRRGPPPEILFSFPLANRRSLIVLNDDAVYVRQVVEQLGLVNLDPDELWGLLSKAVEKKRKPKKDDVAVYVDSATFVQCMEDVLPHSGRKRSSPGTSKHSVSELLSNFYQCFDISMSDRVALDELMGGLTLLCGGKKSMKLAFAFSIFDTRPESKKKKNNSITHSLSGEDLFLFLRSILIVTFSCCRQSLDMDDESVGRCITDTANMICNDVMRHQWETRQADRLNFDEFGQWYNDGGFDRAPWLELLDLHKWVLVDNFATMPKKAPGAPIMPQPTARPTPVVPPPPPEDALDASFFDDTIMPMDSIDEVDMMLMPQPSTDREIDGDSGLRITKSFSFSPRQQRQSDSFADDRDESPLKFHLNTGESHGGYQLSFSRARIEHLRRVLEESGLHKHSAEDACNAILSQASRPSKSEKEPKLTKEGFDAAMKTLITWQRPTSTGSEQTLDGLLDSIFAAFDRDGKGRPSVIEVACGITVLCRGKKSDKLEFAFEVLDKNKQGKLSKRDMTKYLQSFLTVLLSVAFSPALAHEPDFDTAQTMEGRDCDRSIVTINRAGKSGAEWAASLAFGDANSQAKTGLTAMSFDDFADWYTAKGYEHVPWLELIDLRKWLFTSV